MKSKILVNVTNYVNGTFHLNQYKYIQKPPSSKMATRDQRVKSETMNNGQ